MTHEVLLHLILLVQTVLATPSALVLLANGAEEIEAVVTIDVLRRSGIEVTVAGVEGAQDVICDQKTVIKPDVSLSAAAGEYDVIVLPGGVSGTEVLTQSAAVGELLKKQEERSGLIAAICAAPLALKQHGIALGNKLTSTPMAKDSLSGVYEYIEEPVVRDGILITSRAPGTAFEFSLAIVEALVGGEKAGQLRSGMMVN